MTFATRSAVAFAVLSLSSVGATALGGEPAKTSASAETPATKSVSLRVEKMACGTCSQKVTAALSALDGVKTAVVDLKAKGAKVEYDASKVTPERMVKAIVDLGFEASVASGV